MDIAASIVGLVLFAVPMLLIAACILLLMGWPVFFKQQRTGMHGKTFCLHKFRTMTDERGRDGELLPDEVRLKRFGRWLRATSCDELPELWSILRGDMSLVGPRPLLPEYMPYYSNEERRRFDVRPGLTGLAQVSGRNALNWDMRLELDRQYVEQMSFRLDARILWKTIITVFSASGVSADGHATMPRLDTMRAGTDAQRQSLDQTCGER